MSVGLGDTLPKGGLLLPDIPTVHWTPYRTSGRITDLPTSRNEGGPPSCVGNRVGNQYKHYITGWQGLSRGLPAAPTSPLDAQKARYFLGIRLPVFLGGTSIILLSHGLVKCFDDQLENLGKSSQSSWCNYSPTLVFRSRNFAGFQTQLGGNYKPVVFGD